MVYAIRFTEEAAEMLDGIKKGSKRDYEKILVVIKKLADEPDKRGKPLVDQLSGLRSIRAAGQRFRIVYEVNEGQVTVLVVGVGLRKQGDRGDIYTKLQRLFPPG
jgi:mRNA interferase RelE/StbE